MSAAIIAISNEALRLVGDLAVVSLDEGTDLANTVGQIYHTTAGFLLTVHPWRFSMRKARLARLVTPPLAEWPHAHAMPPDLLLLRAIFTSATAAEPLREYEVFERRVFSRHMELWADYQADVDPLTWPPYFRQLVRAALAADFALPVGAGATTAEFWHNRAYGRPMEMMTGGFLGMARRLDSQQQPPQAIRDFPLVAARHGGG